LAGGTLWNGLLYLENKTRRGNICLRTSRTANAGQSAYMEGEPLGEENRTSLPARKRQPNCREKGPLWVSVVRLPGSRRMDVAPERLAAGRGGPGGRQSQREGCHIFVKGVRPGLVPMEATGKEVLRVKNKGLWIMPDEREMIREALQNAAEDRRKRRHDRHQGGVSPDDIANTGLGRKTHQIFGTQGWGGSGTSRRLPPVRTTPIKRFLLN